MSEDNLKAIVNGSLLRNYTGKKVSITGLITKPAPNGLSFEMNCSDDMPIKVSLKKPYQGSLEGYAEVHGTSNGSSVLCDELVEFKIDPNNEFDVVGHNSMVQLLNSIPNLWKYE